MQTLGETHSEGTELGLELLMFVTSANVITNWIVSPTSQQAI